MTVRTRFAPSPTGYMHIGNLRTALYEYLIARHYGGQFVLRIEDTDQARFVEGAVDVIYKTLAMCGLDYDEGPDKDGGYGPYIQSQRKGIYLEYAKQLVELGGAYYCFCSKERLEEIHAKAQEAGEVCSYDGACRDLPKEEVQRRLDNGESYVIRQRMPKEGTSTYTDLVYGEINVDHATLEDQILIKSDGLPTYNFANVIDDHLMNITHIVRGCEYLSSTPKYNLLYDSFGWDRPQYIHLPLIMKEGGGKLSKRDGDASFEDFYEKGFLPEAIINFVALLGWSEGGEKEIYSLDDLIKAFSPEGINNSPAVFDVTKLRWMNGEYIKALSPEKFHELALPRYEKCLTRNLNLERLSSLLQTRVSTINEIDELVDFLENTLEYDVSMYEHKKMKTNLENSLDALKRLYPVLEAMESWTEEAIHENVFKLIEEMGVKNGIIFWPMRTALSGKQSTPGGAIEIAYILGKEETLRRINEGIAKLS
ncbi:MAG: glutamate--tRNA ligase [Clostridiales bacterium]|nr:glutamate--tRNA ligase [Clostridiales bacterium]